MCTGNIPITAGSTFTVTNENRQILITSGDFTCSFAIENSADGMVPWVEVSGGAYSLNYAAVDIALPGGDDSALPPAMPDFIS